MTEPADALGDTRRGTAYRATSCRICGGRDLRTFLDLGSMPIPNGFLREKDLAAPEPRYPLAVALCETCGLSQLTHVVPTEVMFSDYLYVPSTSKTMRDHFESLSQQLLDRYRLGPGARAVEIGSNDGTLLACFRRRGLAVLGVDPAANLVPLARANGVDTVTSPFSSTLAKEIAENGSPRLVVATNVLAHVPDLHDLCDGVSTLIGDDGVFVAEFPYLPELLRKTAFDTIYHEHLSYFSLRPIVRLFAEHGLSLFDAEELPVHGGSLRIHVGRTTTARAVSTRLRGLLEEERSLLAGTDAYTTFAARAGSNRGRLVALLESLKAGGRRVAAYGASAKGNVLLNSCGLGPELVEYVLDSIPYKHGRFTPGTHVPVYPEEKLAEDRPDYLLLFAWNFRDEILAKQRAFRERGGRFILTVPEVHLV